MLESLRPEAEGRRGAEGMTAGDQACGPPPVAGHEFGGQPRLAKAGLSGHQDAA